MQLVGEKKDDDCFQVGRLVLVLPSLLLEQTNMRQVRPLTVTFIMTNLWNETRPM